MTILIIWAILLVAQNFSHTLSSRAKNSHSLAYNAIASTFSNGVWFGSQFFIVQTLTSFSNKGWLYIFGIFVYYIIFTVAGSLLSHWMAMKFFEKKLEGEKDNAVTVKT